MKHLKRIFETNDNFSDIHRFNSIEPQDGDSETVLDIKELFRELCDIIPVKVRAGFFQHDDSFIISVNPDFGKETCDLDYLNRRIKFSQMLIDICQRLKLMLNSECSIQGLLGDNNIDIYIDSLD